LEWIGSSAERANGYRKRIGQAIIVDDRQGGGGITAMTPKSVVPTTATLTGFPKPYLRRHFQS
jgi:hypothetical protein